MNCGNRGSDQTTNLKKVCDGKSSCEYNVDHRIIGDPAGGCPKLYHYEFNCGDGTHKRNLNAEASGKTLSIDCLKMSRHVSIIKAS